MKQQSILSLANISTEPTEKIAKQPDRKKIPSAKPKQKPKEKNPVNKTRPHRHTPDELQVLIDKYFEQDGTEREVIVGNGANKQIKKIRVYTLTGMSLYCGFCDKNELFQLERNPAYTRVIKSARSRIEKIYEENLQTTGNSANIFALKNFGWVDRQEVITEERTIKLDV